jgi:hypothetical protein
MFFFVFWRCVDMLVYTDVSEKYSVSIFQGVGVKAGKWRALIGPELQGLTEGSNQGEGIWDQDTNQ